MAAGSGVVVNLVLVLPELLPFQRSPSLHVCLTSHRF